MGKPEVIDIDLGWADALRAMLTLAGAPSVYVGIHESAGEDLVEIAYANEFGTETIPARSVFRRVIDKNRTRYGEDLKVAIENTLDGSSIVEELETLGEKVVADMQQHMNYLRRPPNAPSTLKQKQGNNPLIDSGRLIGSISAEVR